MLALRIATLAALIVPALADIVPTSPSGNTVVTVGQDIQALWNVDTTGQWTDVEIQLMTGDNFNMVPLATLATGVDGTKSDSLNIPCPDVSPYSKIYFLQFTLAGNVSTATWTTRFTIASTSGQTVEPEQSTVYNGQTVQWGTGALVGAAPAVLTGSGSTSGGNSTTPTTSAAAVSTISVASSASTSASASASDAVNAAAAMSSSSSASGSSTSSTSSTRVAASASATPSSAALRGSTVGLGAIVLGLAGFIAV